VTTITDKLAATAEIRIRACLQACRTNASEIRIRARLQACRINAKKTGFSRCLTAIRATTRFVSGHAFRRAEQTRKKRPALAAVLLPFETRDQNLEFPIRPFYSGHRDNDHLQTRPETARLVSGHAFRHAEQTRKKRPALAAVLLPFEPTTKTGIRNPTFPFIYRDAITYKAGHRRRDSYQGTPSGVPNKREKRDRL
jgi:hypothetical protein